MHHSQINVTQIISLILVINTKNDKVCCVIERLYTLRMHNHSTCRSTKYNITIRQILCSPSRILTVQAIAIIDIDNVKRIISLGIGISKTFVGSYPYTSILALNQTPDIV